MTLLRPVFLLFSLAAMHASTNAIIIRDDVPDKKYRANEKTWSFVLPMDPSNKLQKGECAATLIADRYAVTAAHCFGRKFKKFKIKISGQTYEVVDVHKNPCFSVQKDGPNGADVALIKLNKDAPSSVPRIPVYQWYDEVGERMEMLGWGDTGEQGIKPSQVTTDRKLRFAENIVEKAPLGRKAKNDEKGMLIYSFDKNGLDLEGLAWAGDSGGPLFLTKNGVRYVAGVNSAGDCCKYGDEDAYSRLSIKYNWIMETMKDDSPANFNCRTLQDAEKPIAPTNSPTKKPTRSPTKTPTKAPAPVCEDKKGKFKVRKFGRKDCQWAGEKKANCNKKLNRPHKKKKVRFLCPKTCGDCPDDKPKPTGKPTRAPTREPTRSPTKSPTPSPTRAPTKAPTKSPTKSPTESPTDSPTYEPTAGPTDESSASGSGSGSGSGSSLMD